jgi:Flp pilus assembly protein TadG
MPGALRRLLRLGWRLARDRRGVAAVEFALVMPVLVVLYFGTVEAAALYTVDSRISTISGTMGDLVARVDGSISDDTLTDYFQASTNILSPYSTTGLEQVVSLLKVTSTGTVTVCWSKPYGAGAEARDPKSAFPLPADDETNQMARTYGYLVVSEVTYPYLPLYGMVIQNTIHLSHTEYFLPRYNAYIAITGVATCPT